MIDMILNAIWIFLPAGLANASPVFASRLPILKNFKKPIDLELHFRGKRILGDNKTWRGLLFGIFIASITAFLQQKVHTPITNVHPLLVGAVLGAGALIGDAVESFFKRQFNVASGESWFPYDQLDYIVGGLLFGSLVIDFSLRQYTMILTVWFAIHIISTYIGFLLKLRDKPI